MSTNSLDVPISPQDEVLIPRKQQPESTQSVDSFEHEREKSQSDRKDALTLHSQDSSQTFMNADVLGDILQIPDWPGPQTLEATSRESILRNVGYVLFLVPPLFFLVLVLSALGLHLEKASPFGKFVTQACLLGPTVFPIAFSAILGWCLKTYGRYGSERGIKLGELERVIGSQTVFSFLRLAFTFKQLDRLCIALGILWILSPLGGQGILRMLSMRPLIETSEETVLYLNLYKESRYVVDSLPALARGMIDDLYFSSLHAPVEIKNRTTDLWGMVKIPSIEYLDFDHQGDDGAVVGDVPTYTSLLGIPMNSTAYKSASNHSFTLNTTTFSTQCERPEPFTLIYDPLPGRRGFSLETQSIPGETTVRNISLLTYPWSTSVPVLHNCTITPNFLLAKVECYSGHCSVTRVKKLAYQTTEYFLDVKIWDTIVKQLTSSSNDANSLDYGWSSRTERYIYDPLHTYYGPAAVDLRIVSLTDFGTRFATILNTYYQATISPEVRRGSFETGIYHNETKTTGSTIHSLSSPTYQRHWEWVILAHIASLAMLGVAIIGIWLDKQVVTPDVYGYVSSMTRDNPYFPLPPNGCTLEGTQRAVLLRDVVVQFRDVAPSKKIGHLAFTMAGYKTSTEQSVYCRLPRARMYSGS